jgi:hypothetical protein
MVFFLFLFLRYSYFFCCNIFICPFSLLNIKEEIRLRKKGMERFCYLEMYIII